MQGDRPAYARTGPTLFQWVTLEFTKDHRQKGVLRNSKTVTVFVLHVPDKGRQNSKKKSLTKKKKRVREISLVDTRAGEFTLTIRGRQTKMVEIGAIKENKEYK